MQNLLSYFEIKTFSVENHPFNDFRDAPTFTDVSEDALCQHHGTCINTEDSHRCICTSGYTGSYCETEINECASHPCYNGATCEDLLGDYKCKCKRGYQGLHCELDVDECALEPCDNGGTCLDLENDFRCSCPHG